MLLAGGLAYRTLFATLTLVVFIAGLVGIVIHDPARRLQLIEDLVTVLPEPLRASLTGSVDALGDAGLAIGLVGLVSLYWGASSMYDAIDGAVALVMPGGRKRSGLDRRVRGLVALAALLLVLLTFFVLRPGDGGPVGAVVEPLLAVVAVVALAYGGYRFIPTEPPLAGEALPPAIVAGTAMSLLTSFFAVLAPYLVSRLQAFGVVASFLAALVWLDYLATCFLVGAAWTRARRATQTTRGPRAPAPFDPGGPQAPPPGSPGSACSDSRALRPRRARPERHTTPGGLAPWPYSRETAPHSHCGGPPSGSVALRGRKVRLCDRPAAR